MPAGRPPTCPTASAVWLRGPFGAERLIPPEPARNEAGKVQVAAFDFDGTCIRGNSPVLLVRHLARKRMLAPSVVARILGWAACYKARLPQNESWVRGLVFRAFAGRPVGEVNRFLYDFYDRFIDERFRADAEAAMRNLEEATAANPAWSSLSAVQNGRYITLDPTLYLSKPNARWSDAYQGLFDSLYGQPARG